MTHCVAWHDGQNVWMVADTALTVRGADFTDLRSSFGERTHIGKYEQCQEAYVKVVQLAPHVLATFAGNVERAVTFLNALRKQLRFEPHVYSALESTVKSLGPFAPRHPVELFQTFIGFVENATSFLWHFAPLPPHGQLVDVGPGPQGMLGSLPPRLGSVMSPARWRLVQDVVSGERPPDHPLVAMLAMLQHTGVTNYTLEHGVGGVYLGARLDAEGVHWQPDIRFCLYNPADLAEPGVDPEFGGDDYDLLDAPLITPIIRDGAAAVRTHFHKTVRVVTNDFTADWKAWRDRWGPDVSRILREKTAPFWVYMNATGNGVSIIDRRDSRYILLEEDRILIHRDVVSAMRRVAPAPVLSFFSAARG